MLYGHLDKQPALGEWSEGLDPFAPVRRDDRLYARGVADDGYALFAALLGVRALEREGTGHARCVVLIEASEESGSPDLEAHLDALGDELGRVDLLVCLDSGALTYDRLWVTTSLRGIVMRHGHRRGAPPRRALRRPRAASCRRRSASCASCSTASRTPGPARCCCASCTRRSPTATSPRPASSRRTSATPPPTTSRCSTGCALLGRDGADRLVRRTWEPALSVIGIDGIPAPSDAANLAATLDDRRARRAPARRASTSARRRERARRGADRATRRTARRVTATEYHADGWVAPPLEPWLRDAVSDGVDATVFGREPGFVGEGGTIPFLASLGTRFPSVQFLATGVLGPGSNAHGPDESLHLPTAARLCDVVAQRRRTPTRAGGSTSTPTRGGNR